MIWAALGFAALAHISLIISILLSYRERRTLIAAMLQVNGEPDAARRLAPIVPSKEAAKAAVQTQREIVENGGVFSAANPFGNSKPMGV